MFIYLIQSNIKIQIWVLLLLKKLKSSLTAIFSNLWITGWIFYSHLSRYDMKYFGFGSGLCVPVKTSESFYKLNNSSSLSLIVHLRVNCKLFITGRKSFGFGRSHLLHFKTQCIINFLDYMIIYCFSTSFIYIILNLKTQVL